MPARPSEVPAVQPSSDIPAVQLPSAIPIVTLPSDMPAIQLPAEIPPVPSPPTFPRGSFDRLGWPALNHVDWASAQFEQQRWPVAGGVSQHSGECFVTVT